MRALWSGLILLGVLLPQAEAAILPRDGHPKIEASRIGTGIQARCSDGAMGLRPAARRLQILRNQAGANPVDDSFLLEKEFSGHLLAKTKCVNAILIDVLGPEFRMQNLVSDQGRLIWNTLERLRNDSDALKESHPTAKAMVILIDNIRATAHRAEADMDYMTLGGYASERVRDLERRIEFFAEGLKRGGGGHRLPLPPIRPPELTSEAPAHR